MTSVWCHGGSKCNDIRENQMTKFYAEFSNFMQNLLTCRQLECGPKTGGWVLGS